jgi:hypothetical protein
MKRYWQWIACAIVVMAATTLASAQALGDVARQERTKQKPQASKTITNEDLPSADTAQAAPSTDAKKDDAGEGKAEEKNSAEDKVKQMQDWKARIATQDAKVKDLDREINLMQREYKLRTAVFYADAGARIRDERAWADSERKYQADLSAKQKVLGAERTKLDDLREAARKAGVGGLE